MLSGKFWNLVRGDDAGECIRLVQIRSMNVRLAKVLKAWQIMFDLNSVPSHCHVQSPMTPATDQENLPSFAVGSWRPMAFMFTCSMIIERHLSCRF